MAADLGGNCCADLEERIAELEATTARKGNRKVSLTITGWVSEQIVAWDDGVERNTYIGGVGTTLSTNVQIVGSAQITSDVKAGYALRIEVNPNDPFTLSQDNDNHINPNLPNFGFGVFPLESNWFLQSNRFGKLAVGKLSPASDNAAILPQDGSGTLFPANWVLFDPIRGFQLRRNGAAIPGVGGGALTWGDIANCAQLGPAGAGIGSDCTAVFMNAIRYDSPVFGGFSVSASWGEDDFWDVAARYSGEFSGIKVSIGGAYSRNKDENFVIPFPTKRDVGYFQIGAYAEHVASGIWVYGAYGTEQIESATKAAPDTDDQWYVKAGVKLKPFSIGQTIPYAEYGQHNDMLSILVPGATGSQINRWGVGVVQNIDAAAMSVWLAYRHLDGNIEGGPAAGGLDGFEFVKAGAVIGF